MHCNEIQKHWPKGYALSFEFHIKDNHTLPPWDTFMCTNFKLLVTTVTTLLASVTDGELWLGLQQLSVIVMVSAE